MENYTGERCPACGAEVYEDERGEETCRCKSDQDHIDARKGK